MYRKLLVPTDGSDLSQRAVVAAVALAKEQRAQIAFLYAKPDYQASIYGEAALMEAAAPKLFYAVTEVQAQDILARASSVASAADVPSVSLSVTADKPHEAIIATAEREACDLIVIASHGRSGVSSVLLGSVTLKVLAHCKLPVLVYR